VDLVPAVLMGGVFSAAAMLAAMALADGSLMFRAGATDLLLLAGLGFFQLGLPCALMVVAMRRLSAPEVALLSLLEVVLGPLWAWWGAAERPADATLAGGALVLAALVANEAVALRRAAPDAAR
jgi:drug/metabolite transporter (DMT)-like permease